MYVVPFVGGEPRRTLLFSRRELENTAWLSRCYRHCDVANLSVWRTPGVIIRPLLDPAQIQEQRRLCPWCFPIVRLCDALFPAVEFNYRQFVFLHLFSDVGAPAGVLKQPAQPAEKNALKRF